MSDFWAEMAQVFTVESAIDDQLQGRALEGPATTSLRELTDAARTAASLSLPVEAGTRVRFVANLGSVLTYDDIPDPGTPGTVVKVKTAGGKMTARDGWVYVAWDDGMFRPILAEHLRLASTKARVARGIRMAVSSMSDLTAFFSHTGSMAADELVHKATKDLWSVRKDDNGYVIDRLFDSTGKPLKV